MVYVRERDGHQVLVGLNLSAAPQQIKFTDAATTGDFQDLFDGKKLKLKSDKVFDIPAWGYKVLFR